MEISTLNLTLSGKGSTISSYRIRLDGTGNILDKEIDFDVSGSITKNKTPTPSTTTKFEFSNGTIELGNNVTNASLSEAVLNLKHQGNWSLEKVAGRLKVNGRDLAYVKGTCGIKITSIINDVKKCELKGTVQSIDIAGIASPGGELTFKANPLKLKLMLTPAQIPCTPVSGKFEVQLSGSNFKIKGKPTFSVPNIDCVSDYGEAAIEAGKTTLNLGKKGAGFAISKGEYLVNELGKIGVDVSNFFLHVGKDGWKEIENLTPAQIKKGVSDTKDEMKKAGNKIIGGGKKAVEEIEKIFRKFSVILPSFNPYNKQKTETRYATILDNNFTNTNNLHGPSSLGYADYSSTVFETTVQDNVEDFSDGSDSDVLNNSTATSDFYNPYPTFYEVINDDIYLLKRTSEGILTVKYNTKKKKWTPFETYCKLQDKDGWINSKYGSTLRTNVVGNRYIYLTAIGPSDKAIIYKFDTNNNNWTPINNATANKNPVILQPGKTHNWLLHTTLVENKYICFISYSRFTSKEWNKSTKTINADKFDLKTKKWTHSSLNLKLNSMGFPIYNISTSRIHAVGKEVFLFMRTSLNLAAYKFDTKNNNWTSYDNAKNAPQWSDKKGWNKSQYSHTIRTNKVGKDIYVFARNKSGIETHKFNTQNKTWTAVPLKKAPQLSNDKDWSKPHSYETIRTVAIGKNIYLFGRNKWGIETHKLNTENPSTWEEVNHRSNRPKVSLHNDAGWNQPLFYTSIQAVPVKDNIYLMTINPKIDKYRFNIKTKQWSQEKEVVELFADNNFKASKTKIRKETAKIKDSFTKTPKIIVRYTQQHFPVIIDSDWKGFQKENVDWSDLKKKSSFKILSKEDIPLQQFNNSIILPSGWAIQVYDQPNLKGESKIITKTWSSKNDKAWQNRIKSLRVLDPIDFPLPSSTYYIHLWNSNLANIKGGKSDKGTPINLWNYNGSKAQRWKIKRLENGFYNIKSELGKCLDVANANPIAETKVQIWDCNNTKTQEWQLTKHPNGMIEIKSALGTCFETKRGKTNKDNPVWMNDCNGTKAQQWWLKPTK